MQGNAPLLEAVPPLDTALVASVRGIGLYDYRRRLRHLRLLAMLFSAVASGCVITAIASNGIVDAFLSQRFPYCSVPVFALVGCSVLLAAVISIFGISSRLRHLNEALAVLAALVRDSLDEHVPFLTLRLETLERAGLVRARPLASEAGLIWKWEATDLGQRLHRFYGDFT
jgi:hypothetical protein